VHIIGGIAVIAGGCVPAAAAKSRERIRIPCIPSGAIVSAQDGLTDFEGKVVL
jgi:hypothetical protein